VTSGAATRDTAAFAGQLRRAGEVLVGANGGDEPALAAALDAITGGIGTAAPPAPAPSPPPAPVAVAAPRVRVSGSAPPVPRSVTAVRDDVPSPIDDDTPAESDDLIGTWVTYRRLVGAGVGPASLDELLAGGAAVAVTEPVANAALGAEPDVVDIRSLLFRGERALVRARELRAEARSAPSAERLQEILDELGDLVALAAEPVA
jgi:hypothetical protein